MKQDLSKIKVGYYIYDISTNIAGFQVNQYKVLYIDDTYIYCVNNKGVKGRFKKSDDAIYTNINSAKEVAHRMFQEKLKKEKKEKEKQIKDANFERLKTAFYNKLKGKKNNSIFNHIEIDLESRVRNQQILDYRNQHTEKNTLPKPSKAYEIKTQFYVYEKKKKYRPSVPYKILPNGAIVSINEEDKD